MRQQIKETFLFLCFITFMCTYILMKGSHFPNNSYIPSSNQFVEERVQELVKNPEFFRSVLKIVNASQFELELKKEEVQKILKANKDNDKIQIKKKDQKKIAKVQKLPKKSQKSYKNVKKKAVIKKTVVLVWTKYYPVDDHQLLNMISGRKYDPTCCTGDDLLVTLDRKMLPNATAIVFFHGSENLHRIDLPPTRTPDQVWVLYFPESHLNFPLSPDFSPHFFNWTMSYRRDSDIWSPFGFTSHLEAPIPFKQTITMPNHTPLSQWILNKSHLLVRVTTHCSSDNSPAAERSPVPLQSANLPLDLYQVCGSPWVCARTGNKTSCDSEKIWLDLATKYKFYLATEDALCVDYVTGDFWRALARGMVPVVYGDAVNYTAIAPPNSFIDASYYTSFKKLAEYLQEVAQDTRKYAKYFEWRRQYMVTPTDGWGGWCNLCQMARAFNNSPKERKMAVTKSYPDLAKWWGKENWGSEEPACRKETRKKPAPPSPPLPPPTTRGTEVGVEVEVEVDATSGTEVEVEVDPTRSEKVEVGTTKNKSKKDSKPKKVGENDKKKIKIVH